MKRIIAFLLSAIMCIALTACNDSNEKMPEEVTSSTESSIETESATVAETEPPTPEIPTAQLKETVSTDIVDFTLEHSKLTYYVSNSSTNYVEATDKANTFFAAKMGTCYVSMTVTVSNKDRGGSLNLPGQLNVSNWTVTYNGEEYPLTGFNLNSSGNPVSFSYAAIVDKETGKVHREVGTSNDLLSAGQTRTYRFFGIIKADPESLNDGFELNIKVPNSSGEYEDFKYIVPAIS